MADDRRAPEHAPKPIKDELWENSPTDESFEQALAIPDDEFDQLIEDVDALADKRTKGGRALDKKPR